MLSTRPIIGASEDTLSPIGVPLRGAGGGSSRASELPTASQMLLASSSPRPKCPGP